MLTALVRLGSRETSPDLPLFDLFASALGRVLGEAVAIGSAVVLFMALYRYATSGDVPGGFPSEAVRAAFGPRRR